LIRIFPPQLAIFPYLSLCLILLTEKNMSTEKLIIEERSRDIGQFLVGRLLPFRKKRMVGPFIFIDHMGPVVLGDGKYMGIDRHPHIGLSTLTYLFEGEAEHRDSMGTVQRIRPGDVNWMTAGKGITHTERTPAELRDGRELSMNGYQIWVALPKEKEDIEPEFQHLPAEELPRWQQGGMDFTLVAGSGYGRKSPLKVHSDLFMLEVYSENGGELETRGKLSGEIGIIVVEGSVESGDELIEAGKMLVSKESDVCTLDVGENTRLLIFGGEAFPEGRYIHWNFVSSQKRKIEKAEKLWREDKFPKIEGDDTYIPMP
jgi:redox-sensitive bicupin YhaK (pirin superfamily)